MLSCEAPEKGASDNTIITAGLNERIPTNADGIAELAIAPDSSGSYCSRPGICCPRFKHGKVELSVKGLKINA